jgi:hypothetical protein
VWRNSALESSGRTHRAERAADRRNGEAGGAVWYTPRKGARERITAGITLPVDERSRPEPVRALLRHARGRDLR